MCSSDLVKQVEALGFKLTSSGPWSDETEKFFCHYLDSAPDFPGVALMMNEDRLVRIDIGFGEDRQNWRTLSDAGVGLSEQELKEIYGDCLETSGHPSIDAAGYYLTLTSSDGKYAMIFETAVKDMDEKALKNRDQPKYVTNFRAGLAEPVGYIEGCA